MAKVRAKKNFLQLRFERARQRFAEVIKRNDIFFLITVALLIGIGLCWVCSTTQIQIIKKSGDLSFSYSKLFNQVIALAIGLCGMFFMSVLDFERTVKKFSVAAAVYAITCILLIITLFMPPVLGSRRWIPLGFFNMQTAEFAKIAIVFFIAAYMGNRRYMADMQQNSFKVFYPFILSSIGLVLIAIEPDIGIPTLTFFGICCMMYVSGIALRDIVRVCFFAVPVFVFDCLRNLGHRLGRLQSFALSLFTDDQKVDILGDAFQVANSLTGICSGGLTGRGFAHSHQKVHLQIGRAHV